MLAKIATARSPAETQSAISRLSALATRNPAAANDVLDLQSRLAQAFQSPATAAAAEEQK